jgi:hypothetical protein
VGLEPDFMHPDIPSSSNVVFNSNEPTTDYLNEVDHSHDESHVIETPPNTTTGLPGQEVDHLATSHNEQPPITTTSVPQEVEDTERMGTSHNKTPIHRDTEQPPITHKHPIVFIERPKRQKTKSPNYIDNLQGNIKKPKTVL